MKAKPSKQPLKKQITQVRMDEELKRRIREYVSKFRVDTGATITFSAATRILIEKGLATK